MQSGRGVEHVRFELVPSASSRVILHALASALNYLLKRSVPHSQVATLRPEKRKLNPSIADNIVRSDTLTTSSTAVKVVTSSLPVWEALPTCYSCRRNVAPMLCTAVLTGFHDSICSRV